MAQKHPWSYLMAIPLALGMACTGGNDGSDDTVNVTVQGSYEKQDFATWAPGTIPTTKPTRYAFAQILRNSNGESLANIDLDANGSGTAAVPRGVDVVAILFADVAAPSTSIPAGSGFSMYGSVKKALPETQYPTDTKLNDLQTTWYTTSDVFNTNTSGTVTLKARESTSEAGAFAIADQMVEFALGMGKFEPGLPLPDLHTFWAPGTATTYPSSNATVSANGVLLGTTTRRPILLNEIRYAGPSNCADAYNDSLLQETFAHSLFAYGSYWSPMNQPTAFGALVRCDGDAAYVDPFVASESTMAFTNGFRHFISAAIRPNDPQFYYMYADGTKNTPWSLNSHDRTPIGGGEFYGGSVARSMWGIWKNAFGGSYAGLETLWKATLAGDSYEYGKAPLACYPTYLRGLERLAGSPNLYAIQAELDAEKMGNGTNPVSNTYFNSSTLWITIPTGGGSIPGSLTTFNNANLDFQEVYFDRVQSQAYRFTHSGGNRVITLAAASSGLIVELFDSLGYVKGVQVAAGSTDTLRPSAITLGDCVVRVRLDPSLIYNGSPANFSLTVN